MMDTEISTIAVMTSGGDSPGMNAALRAVARGANRYNLTVWGIYRGYQGLIEDKFVELDSEKVSNIIQRGGTILKSARSQEFRTEEGRTQAAVNLKNKGIDALVVIGGDGTFTGANLLSKEHNIRVIGIPATIDNDIIGTDETIGYDTALNTAIEAIDKIRDTADAHERMFLVEVMGRDAGFIALETGIAVGAELSLLPEELTSISDIKSQLKDMLKEQKRSSLVVVAEGDETGGALKLAEKIKDDFAKYDLRVCILGHIQRGGSPSARDRVLASRLGASAINVLMEGHNEVMVGVVNNALKITPLRVAVAKKKGLDYGLIELATMLR
ncbi:MAG: 6-phosphofructokinase [Rhodothermaeota bacterium MED-G12]|jgi:6-phosphofructokinase 1|nr:MAG: 6-phosphofructokinase [Rhodothermaeota bacterium MED-G12]CAI8333070.1 MAG: ATP-dependent 6-phosphofructokinase 1 [Rhodothermaeota bacterium MED-G12]